MSEVCGRRAVRGHSDGYLVMQMGEMKTVPAVTHTGRVTAFSLPHNHERCRAIVPAPPDERDKWLTTILQRRLNPAAILNGDPFAHLPNYFSPQVLAFVASLTGAKSWCRIGLRRCAVADSMNLRQKVRSGMGSRDWRATVLADVHLEKTNKQTKKQKQKNKECPPA